jgi:hypothetical protein
VLELRETLENGLIGLVISTVGTYFIAVWKGAELIDSAHLAESAGLKKRVDELTPPKRTPEQERKYATASAALEGLGQKARIVLCHLANHGSLKFNGFATPLPHDIGSRETREILDRCCDAGLVTRIEQPRIVPGVSGYIADYVYTIATGMASVLQELLG